MKIIYNKKEYEVENGINGFGLAKIVDPEKKNKALAYKENKEEFDMNTPLINEGEVSFIMSEDKEGFAIMNHSCSHLMAQAIKHLYPKALFGFGPSIEEGFYY
ncbi:MAG TPA: threonine--tRNA ligase, partial [Firmicutes bacterium]|nr:threonine--tRNA ligase [Bacillota bacterium]